MRTGDTFSNEQMTQAFLLFDIENHRTADGAIRMTKVLRSQCSDFGVAPVTVLLQNHQMIRPLFETRRQELGDRSNNFAIDRES